LEIHKTEAHVKDIDDQINEIYNRYDVETTLDNLNDSKKQLEDDISELESELIDEPEPSSPKKKVKTK
jgi:peptidoglycan hydrolase CwlO-like protein